MSRLRVAKRLRDAEAMQYERRTFKRQITERGKSTFEVVRKHDALEFDAALVC